MTATHDPVKKAEYNRRYWNLHRDEILQKARERWVANRETLLPASREYYKRTRETVLAERKQPGAEREKRLAFNINYHAEHRDEILRRKRERYHNNLAEARLRCVVARWRIRGVPPDPETIAYMRVLRRDPCAYCGVPSTGIDHIVPICAGGQSTIDNLAPCCSVCNSAKHHRSLLQFLSQPPPRKRAPRRRQRAGLEVAS